LTWKKEVKTFPPLIEVICPRKENQDNGSFLLDLNPAPLSRQLKIGRRLSATQGKKNEYERGIE
jgi:hypothetical protein